MLLRAQTLRDNFAIMCLCAVCLTQNTEKRIDADLSIVGWGPWLSIISLW